MYMQNRKQTPIALFILLSISAHGFVLFLPDAPGSFEFASPRNFTQVDLVEMNGANESRFFGEVRRKPENTKDARRHSAVLEIKSTLSAQEKRQGDDNLAADHPEIPLHKEPGKAKECAGRDEGIEEVSLNGVKVSDPVASGNSMQSGPGETKPSQKWDADEIFSPKREKLTFRILMFGMPVGSAVLEAVHDGNGVRISSTVNSNSVISTLYPVSDYAETRLIAGRYIISRVRQREGSFTSDTGFTLDLPGKTVHWVDRQRNLFDSQKLPREDLLDILSGFYYLRNQRLEVGVPVKLHLYDSDTYAETTVEVLRREHVSIPGFRDVEAIVVHPLIKTDSIFRRAGDILVWLTDDEFKVPVRFETSIPLGRVTAELISSEVERSDKTEELFRGDEFGVGLTD